MIHTCRVCGKEFEAKNGRDFVCQDCHIGTCVVCGKEFERQHPYTQKTCSSKCRGIYRKQSGIAKASRAKAEQTFQEKYDSKGKSRVKYAPKTCAYCGKEFIPNSSRQKYCKGPHYGPCPICGKQVEIKDMYIGPTVCSEECRKEAIRRTTQQRYDVDNVFQSAQIKSKIKSTLLRLYGVDHYAKTPEFREKFKCTVKQHYGVESPLQSEEIRSKVVYTNQERYGADWVTQSEEVKSKVRKTVESHGGFTFERPDLQKQIANTNLERYGDAVPVRTDLIQKRRSETMIAKYGAKSPLSIGSTLRFSIQQTNLEKYGSISVLGNPEIRAKVIDTWKSRYGVDNPFASPEIQSKIRAHLLERYGVDNPQKSEDIRRKTELTNLKKYGSTTYTSSTHYLHSIMQDPSKLDEFIQFRQNPEDWIKHHYDHKVALYELSKVLGVDIATVSKYILNTGCSNLIAYHKSTMELDVMNFLNSLDPNIQIQHNNRTILAPKEVDIYLPEYKLGIECTPTYTHNSSKSAYNSGVILPRTYHRDKSLDAVNQGIFLFHIYGYQWTNFPDIVKSMLMHLLHYDSHKYYARNLVTREVSDAESKRFLNQNHLQGYTTSKVRLGLYDDSDLVSLMTFSKSRGLLGYSNSSSDTWELTRFCTKLYSNCVGGASKLFKYFVQQYQPTTVVSFSSIDCTTGNVYSKLGFQIDSYVDPGYVWVHLNTDHFYTRVTCQKKNLPKLFNELNLDIEHQTESQIMESHGYARVYNSGLIKWVYNNQQ